MSALAGQSTKLKIRVAMEARDLTAVVDAFAPNAVIRSPLTGRLTFQGHDQIGAVMGVILDVFKDLRYTDELQGADSAILIASARVGGSDIEIADHLRFDEGGKIRELTVFFRPMPSIAVAMRLIGTALGRRKSKARAQTISLLTRPLGLMTSIGDRVGVRLVGPTL